MSVCLDNPDDRLFCSQHSDVDADICYMHDAHFAGVLHACSMAVPGDQHLTATLSRPGFQPVQGSILVIRWA